MPYEMHQPFLAVLSGSADGYRKDSIPKQWLLRGEQLVVPLKRIGKDTFNPLPPEYSALPIMACYAEQYLPFGGIILVRDEQGERIPASILTQGRNLPRNILGWYSTFNLPIMTVIALPKTGKGPKEIKVIRRSLERQQDDTYIIGREKLCEVTDPSGLPPKFERFREAVEEAYAFLPPCTGYR